MKRPSTAWPARVAFAASCGLSLACANGFAQQHAPVPNTKVSRGKMLYERKGCYECHLHTGAGYSGIPGGAPLVPMSLSLRQFTRFLRNPSNPRRMPPYSSKLLSDDDAAAIYAFIRMLPDPRPAQEIPSLATIIDAIRHSKDAAK